MGPLTQAVAGGVGVLVTSRSEPRLTSCRQTEPMTSATAQQRKVEHARERGLPVERGLPMAQPSQACAGLSPSLKLDFSDHYY